MMHSEAVGASRALITHLEKNRDHLIIDADTHPTLTDSVSELNRRQLDTSPNYYHGRPITCEELLQEMDMTGVDMALSWQNPAFTRYTANKEQNFGILLKANLDIKKMARRYPDRIIPAGWTDPKAVGIDLALKIVEHCILEFGFLIVKMNPAQNAYSVDTDEVFTVVDRIVEMGGIPAFHYGADTPYTTASAFEKVALRHPEWPVIAVHMGGGGCSYLEGERQYIESRALGLRRPNVHFILSTKRDTHIESDLITYQMAGEPYCRNLSVGSDAPYGRVSWNVGGYRQMFNTLMDINHHPDPRIRDNPGLFTEDAVANYMGRNFADLLLRGYRRLLRRNEAG